MKIYKLILTILLMLTTSLGVFANDMVLKTGISIDKVPKGFYGTWRVKSELISTNNESIYKKNSVDLWNLSRVGNVISLNNPFSGANASITVDEIKDKSIKFSKIGTYENNTRLSDTVELTLSKDSFTGINHLELDTLSTTNGHVLKSEKATYKLSGEKLSGESIEE